MTIPVEPTWHQANFQYLWTSSQRIRQILTDYINRSQALPVQISSATNLSPEALAVLQNRSSALERLCKLFNLSDFERDILLLCAAVELDPSFEELLIKAQGSLQRNYPTLSLALSAFPESHWYVLSSQSPLQKWKLIEIELGQTLTKSPIKINKRILCYLLSEPCLDDELAGILKPYSTANYSNIPLPPSHKKIAEQLIVLWSSGMKTRNFTIVQLCGTEINSKYAIASTACTHLKLKLSVISATLLPTDPNQLNSLKQQCLREVVVTDSALLLDCDEINLADSSREWAISQFIEGLNIPVVISTQERIRQGQNPTINLDINQPTHREQRDIWQSHLGLVAEEINGHIPRLVSQFNLSSSAIQAACLSLNNLELENISESETKVAEVAESTPAKIEISSSPIVNHLWDFCRSQSRPHLEDLAQRIEAFATWDDLILAENEKNILRDIAIHVRQRAKVYQEWGFANWGTRGLGISALFSGASGTGKTMSAEVLAKELRLDLYRIDLSAVVSKYIGETEKNLRRIFDAAETSGAILLFDEADALFGKRTQVNDSHDRHANVEVSYLLQRMESYQGLAILTTNLKQSLDQAFLRRIRFFVNFAFPNADLRSQIWERIFPKQTPTHELDYKKLGKLNMPGGNIRNIALNAAFIAAEAGEPVMMKHILQATKSEYVKSERPLTDVEVRGWV